VWTGEGGERLLKRGGKKRGGGSGEVMGRGPWNQKNKQIIEKGRGGRERGRGGGGGEKRILCSQKELPEWQ